MSTGRPLMGELAIRFGIVDEAAVDEAVSRLRSARAEGEAPRRLYELLVEAAGMRPAQAQELGRIQTFLRVRAKDRAFAKAAVSGGVVGEDEIQYAFQAQETAFKDERAVRSVGELLVELGALDEGLRHTLMEEAAGLG